MSDPQATLIARYITCGCHLADVPELSDHLVNRFQQGLVVEVHHPDFIMRKKILNRLAERFGLGVTEDVLDFIASREVKGISGLEGIVNILRSWTSIHGSISSVERAKDILDKIARSPTPGYKRMPWSSGPAMHIHREEVT